MIDLELTKKNGYRDINIVNGELQVVRDGDVHRQCLEFKLEFFQNDWFLDLSFGIPYFGRVFQRGVSNADLMGIFRNAIEEEPYIVRAEELDLRIDAPMRVLYVTGSALSITGKPVVVDSMQTVT